MAPTTKRKQHPTSVYLTDFDRKVLEMLKQATGQGPTGVIRIALVELALHYNLMPADWATTLPARQEEAKQ